MRVIKLKFHRAYNSSRQGFNANETKILNVHSLAGSFPVYMKKGQSKKEKKEGKKDAAAIPLIKCPDDRPKKNSPRASKGQKENILGLRASACCL